MLKKYIPEIFKNEIKILLNRIKNKDSFILSPYIDKESVLFGNNKVLRNSEIYKSELGKYSYVNSNSIISYSSVGKFTSIGSNCTIGTPNHPVTYLSTSPFTYNEEATIKDNKFGFSSIFETYSKKTLIGNDCWIGNNVVIMQGITIGDGVIIGAGSIVTKDIESYCIAVGVPAKVIKKRFDDDQLNYLIKLNIDKWWDLEGEEFKNMQRYFNENSNWFKV